MTIKTRRILICVGVFSLLLIAVIPLFSGGLYLGHVADRLFPPGPPGQNLNSSHRDQFLSLCFLGMLLAIAISVVFCLWHRRPTKTATTVAYFCFAVVLASMSSANFAWGDFLLNRKAQALIDFVLVPVGTITFIKLLEMRPASTTGNVLRAVIAFIILLQGIILPALYGLLWLLNWQNAITLTQSRGFNAAWISAAGGVVSAIVAILNYRATKRAANIVVGDVSKEELGRRLKQ